MSAERTRLVPAGSWSRFGPGWTRWTRWMTMNQDADTMDLDRFDMTDVTREQALAMWDAATDSLGTAAKTTHPGNHRREPPR